MTDNLAIWNAVSKTNPANTKPVNQRGGFTSICAQSQVMEATRQFGPIGIGWGYIAAAPTFHDNLLFVQITLWHGSRDNTYGPMLGCAEWKSDKGRLDSDAGKKATTDALTKLLSQLGFNADVFLGLYDDSKYVEQVKREFEPKIELITEDQRDEIAVMASGAGVELIKICRAEQVASLKDLPASKYATVIENLKTTMAARVAAKQKEDA